MANIYDTINQLELEIRDHEAYLGLKNGMEAVRADEVANTLYDTFRQLQTSVQMKAQMGQEVTEEEIKQAQDMQKEMTENALISDLLDKERILSQLLDDINGIVTRPIQEVYGASTQNIE